MDYPALRWVSHPKRSGGPPLPRRQRCGTTTLLFYPGVLWRTRQLIADKPGLERHRGFSQKYRILRIYILEYLYAERDLGYRFWVEYEWDEESLYVRRKYSTRDGYFSVYYFFETQELIFF